MPSLPANFEPGQVILKGVDAAVRHRWDQAQRAATLAAGATPADTVRNLTKTFSRELTATGAAAGGTAAVPGIGTMTAVGTAAAELGWFGMRSADLILAIAASHGHTEADVEARRAWVLSILAFGDSAASGFTKIAGTMGKGLGTKATKSVPQRWLMVVNRKIGRTLVTKWGTKRGVVVLGRLLPFGIGAAVGGGANYVMVRTLARQADRFFGDLPALLSEPVASATAFRLDGPTSPSEAEARIEATE